MTGRGFHIVIIALLAIANLLLKGWCIDANAVALDEPFSIYHAQYPVSEIVQNLKGGNNPPLYEIVLHFWMKWFGLDPWSVRFPSLIFTTLTAVLVYLIGANFVSRFVGVLGALIFTLSNYTLMIAHEARGYALLMFLFALAVYLLMAYRKKRLKIGHSLLFGITCALMSYTHYFGFFLTLLLLVFLVMGDESVQRGFKKMSSALIVYLLCFGWYLPDLVHRILATSEVGTWVQSMENLGNLHDAVMWWSNGNKYLYLGMVLALWGGVWMMIKRSKVGGILKWITLLIVVPGFIAVGYSIFFPMPFLWKLTSNKWFSLVFALAILVPWLFQFYYTSRKKWLLVGMVILPLLGLFLISFEIPLFSKKYISFLLPVVCIVIALAVQNIVRSAGPRFILGVFLILGFASTVKLYESNQRDADTFVGFASGLQQQHTRVILGPMQYKYTFLYHYDRELFRDFRNVEGNLRNRNIFPVTERPEVPELVSDTDKHVVFVDANTHTMYPNNGIASYLNERYTLISKHRFEGGYEIFQFVNLKP